MKYDITLRINNGNLTKFKGIRLETLKLYLNKLENNIIKNKKEGTISYGNHINSKTVESNNTKNKI